MRTLIYIINSYYQPVSNSRKQSSQIYVYKTLIEWIICLKYNWEWLWRGGSGHSIVFESLKIHEKLKVAKITSPRDNESIPKKYVHRTDKL